jgi:hypothetical protein
MALVTSCGRRIKTRMMEAALETAGRGRAPSRWLKRMQGRRPRDVRGASPQSSWRSAVLADGVKIFDTGFSDEGVFENS